MPYLPQLECPEGWHVEFRPSTRRKRTVTDFDNFVNPNYQLPKGSWLCVKNPEPPTYVETASQSDWLWCQDLKKLFWHQIYVWMQIKFPHRTALLDRLKAAVDNGYDEFAEYLLNSQHDLLQQYLAPHMSSSRLIPIVRCDNKTVEPKGKDDERVPNPFDDDPDPGDGGGGGRGGGGFNPKFPIIIPGPIPVDFGDGDDGDDTTSTVTNTKVVEVQKVKIEVQRVETTIPGTPKTIIITKHVSKITNLMMLSSGLKTTDHLYKLVDNDLNPRHGTGDKIIVATVKPISELGDQLIPLRLADFQTSTEMYLTQHDTRDNPHGHQALFKPLFVTWSKKSRQFNYLRYQPLQKQEFAIQFRNHEVDTYGHYDTRITKRFWDSYPQTYYQKVPETLTVDVYEHLAFYKTTYLQTNWENWYPVIAYNLLQESSTDPDRDKYFQYPDSMMIKFT